jgi:NADH-quinone oxidoreductase subunit F
MNAMDLKPLQKVLEEYAPQGRTALLPALHAAQSLYHYIPEEAAAEVGHALGVPLVDVFGVIDFYTMFYTHPVTRTVLHICNDPVCAMRGSEALMKMLTRHYHVNERGAVETITIERAPCLGLCENAPAMIVNEAQRGHVDPDQWIDPVEEMGERPYAVIGGEISLLTANCGNRHPTTLAEYRAGGGYQALAKAVQATPASMITEVKSSGLVGRGGAAFPTGVKWEGAANTPVEPRYVVCNGDEAEPGTFKDRVLLEEDPHRVLEGLILSGYAVGAHKGYMFIRGEYYRAYQTMLAALAEARSDGLLGKNILGSGFDFEVELRQGAGAYVCGEETALFEAIEGKRGFPRIKPPFPTTSGLFGKPTVINNVETLANIPLIIGQGAESYRKIGTQKSPGPKLFCVSGDVSRPGLYEVPFGITIRHLLFDLAGGVRLGRSLKGILFGGAAGAFASDRHLDVHLSFEDLNAAGLPLGSGVITVFDDTRDMKDVLLRLAHFFSEESCGKCYPCQLGTQRQVEILQRIARGKTLPGDSQRLQDVGWTMKDASLCGLGQTAASAVLSAMNLWPNLFE